MVQRFRKTQHLRLDKIHVLKSSSYSELKEIWAPNEIILILGSERPQWLERLD